MIGIAILVLAAVLLFAGAELFADNAAGAGRRLGVTALAVALLLAGAEPEEMVTAVIAALNGRPDLAAGDAIGANVTMLTLVIGLTALIRPLPFDRRVREYAVGAALAGAAAVAVLLDGNVSRLEGSLLVAAYVALVAAVWWRERQPPLIGEAAEAADGDDEEDAEEGAREAGPVSAWQPLALALVGVAIMLGGGWVAVEGATRLVADLGIRDSVIGLTLLALATTAELFALAWSATRREITELAVAAVIGSAAYNATVSLGAAAISQPLDVSGILGAAVAAAMLPLLLVALARSGRLGRPAAVVLVLGYALYVLATIGSV